MHGSEHAFCHPPFEFYFCACRLSGRQEQRKKRACGKFEPSHAEARSNAAQIHLPNRRSVAAKGTFPYRGITQGDVNSHFNGTLSSEGNIPKSSYQSICIGLNLN